MNYDYEEQETGGEENQTADANKEGGMTVLVVEPLKPAYLKTISGDLKSLQKEVGGLIDATYPFEDRVAVVLNDKGKLDCLMPNRGLYDNAGSLYDIVAGIFLVVGLGEESFCSLNEEMAVKYLEKYKVPEMVVCINGQLGMFQIPEEWIRDRVSVNKEFRQKSGSTPGKTRKGYEEIDIRKLTLANLSRNKKRTVMTIFTLGATGIFFNFCKSL